MTKKGVSWLEQNSKWVRPSDFFEQINPDTMLTKKGKKKIEKLMVRVVLVSVLPKLMAEFYWWEFGKPFTYKKKDLEKEAKRFLEEKRGETK